MVRVNAYAFDKNSSALYGEQITAETKEEFNTKMDEFYNSIPFTKYYTEVEPVGDLSEQDWEIVTDHDLI